MITGHAVEAVREAEGVLLRAEFPPDGPPSGTVSGLMKLAAAGLAARAVRELKRRCGRVGGAQVVILVGSGDNGGDAMLAGARLAARGARVTAVLLADRAHADALTRLREVGGRVVRLASSGEDAAFTVAQQADLLLDGILGIGATGGLREPAASLVARLESARASVGFPLVMAVDLPSGVGPDDGSVPGPVLSADVTVTFGAMKPCLMLPPAADRVGRVELIDIGLDIASPPAVWRLEAEDIRDLWPRPSATSQKYSRGVLGSVSGSGTYTGAAVLSAESAVRTGVGMLRFNGSAESQALVRARIPEAVHGDGRVQAWVLGSGVDPDDDSLTSQIRAALTSGLPCVADAGALGVVAELVKDTPRSQRRPWLLTPHAGEAAALLSSLGHETSRTQVEAAPAEAARSLARLTSAAVLLKGAVTLVAGPEGTLFSQADGTPWLATAGSGDVLAGIAGALVSGLQARAEAEDDSTSISTDIMVIAGAAAASVHGRAGRWAAAARDPGSGHPISAGDIIDGLHPVLTW